MSLTTARGRLISSTIGRAYGISAITSGQNQIVNYLNGGTRRNFYAGQATVVSGSSVANKNGFPDGYLAPTSYMLPQKGGGAVSKNNRIIGDGTITASGQLGLITDASLSGSGDVTTAIGSLILDAIAILTGTGAINIASIEGIIEATANLSGSASVTAGLGALAGLVCDIIGDGTVSATPSATASMSANINVTGDVLTTANVAEAVWNALAASFDDPNTMGELLNSVGAGANPWSALLSANNDPGTFGERVQKLLTVAKYLGLK